MRLRTLSALIAVLTLLVVLPAGAATPPTIPFDSTADLFILDDDCLCLLMVDEDGLVSVAASENDILTADDNVDVEFSDSGIAVAANGTVYFANDETDSLLSWTPGDGVMQVVSGSEAESQVTGDVGLEKLAFGPNGTLYAVDETGDRILAYDVSAETVSVHITEAQLEAPADIDNADLSGGLAVDASGNLFVATEDDPNAVLLIPAGSTTVEVLAIAPNEVQAVETDATGGTFTLTFDGEETAPIAFDASASAVESALEALSNIDDVTVAGSGTAADPWVVEFTGPNVGGSGQSEFTFDSSNLTGGTGTVSVDETSPGGSFSDLDVYATLDGDGALVIAEDSIETIYRITATGELRALLTDEQIATATGNDPAFEGGIAFDEDGRLLIADSADDELLRFDGTSGEVFVSNQAFSDATGGDPDFGGGIAFRMPLADLTPTITPPASAVAGATVSFAVTVTNNGPNSIDAFELATTGLSGATVSGDTTDLAAGDSVELTIEGTVPSDTTGTLALSVTTAPSLGAIDTDDSNDTDGATVPVSTSADLAVTLSAPATLAVDGTADIEMIVTNNGPSDAQDVVATATLPDGMTLQVAAASDFVCTEDGGVVTCTRTSMPAGASETITLTVTTEELDCTTAGVDAPIDCSFDGEVLSNLVVQASVTSSTADPVQDNDAGTATLVLDTSDVEVDLPAAGVTTNGLATSSILSLLLGLGLLRLGRREVGTAMTG